LTLTTVTNWEDISRSPEFLLLYRRRRRIQLGLLWGALLYYFALPIGAGYFPEVFRVQVFGPVNVGLLFALSQFVVAAAAAIAYARVSAQKLDPLAQALAAKHLPSKETTRAN
jgi:uncharacterized membrane protein (DUF485 family)